MDYKIWRKLSQDQIQKRVFDAIDQNVNYENENALGIPASYLDDKVFNQDVSFLKEAPFISTLVKNPNHIGCHTQGKSESFFKGTQEIEKELMELIAVDILKADPKSTDGYVASGGTEANIQAIWIYRNYYLREKGASPSEIAILCSEDSHYSMDKAGDLLGIPTLKVKVDEKDRSISREQVSAAISSGRESGIKYFIVVANMMTTMYGSVDAISVYTDSLVENEVEFKLHVDGAYGGFYYPFSNRDNDLNFSNEHVSSVTLDAHKMAQAPYGTGIFVARKGLLQYATTNSASYVEGADCTLIGSRSGANAIAVWMILQKNGPFGWMEKIFILQKRTQWLCDELAKLGARFFRDPNSNIVTIEAEFVSNKTVEKFGLVPDNHNAPNCFKVVVMDHVTIEKLQLLLSDLSA